MHHSGVGHVKNEDEERQGSNTLQQRRTTNPAVLRVFTTFELLELILLNLPPSDILLGQRVHKYWWSLVQSSPVLKKHCSDPFIKTWSLPAKHIKGFNTLTPCQDIRRQHLENETFTEKSLVYYRAAAQKIFQYLPSVFTDISRIPDCPLCAHPHEQFAISLLHPILQQLLAFGDSETGVSICLTAFKFHIVCQVHIPSMEAMEDFLSYMQDTLAPFEPLQHVQQDVPMTKPSATQASISISGIVKDFRVVHVEHGGILTLRSLIDGMLEMLQIKCWSEWVYFKKTLLKLRSQHVGETEGNFVVRLLESQEPVWRECARNWKDLRRQWSDGEA